jgi:hypothetical protein
MSFIANLLKKSCRLDDRRPMLRQTPVISRAETFNFHGWEADSSAGRVRLHYSYDGRIHFFETLDFHHPLPDAASDRRAGFEAAMHGLTLAAGISYYKALLPAHLISAQPLTSTQRSFFRKLYVHGLGEFAYRNRIQIADRINFATGNGSPPATPPPVCDLPRRAAVPLGGGKDSLVSLEVLRAGGEPMLLFAVNPRAPIIDCARASGIELISVTRTIDPKLFQLNDAGAYNGHVPITAIISFIALAGAFVYGYDTISLSNERSADEGNLIADGLDVNHQYSKSTDFETDMQQYIATNVAPRLRYFSLLRPLSELHIARLMAGMTLYDKYFSSCNRNFAIRAASPTQRWCCNCPKCRFAFLMFATVMSPARLCAIFNANLLDDPAQVPGYQELAGLSGHKPWECVGEIEESSAALLALASDPVWCRSTVIAQLAPKLKALMHDHARRWTKLLTPAPTHTLPRRYEEMLHAYLRRR